MGNNLLRCDIHTSIGYAGVCSQIGENGQLVIKTAFNINPAYYLVNDANYTVGLQSNGRARGDIFQKLGACEMSAYCWCHWDIEIEEGRKLKLALLSFSQVIRPSKFARW